MINLNIFYDLYFGMFPFILDIMYIISIVSAIFVITSKNPVISVLYLIGLFFIIGVYLIFIGVEFIGLAYLLVYVGAVSILFLFILMLLNIRVSELTNETKNSVGLIFIVSLVFGNISYVLLPSEVVFYYKNMFANFLINWDGGIAEFLHITNIGNIIYTSFAIWLILISIVLLLAMVGAIVINIKSKLNTYTLKSNIEKYRILQSRFNLKIIAILIRILITAIIIWCIKFILIEYINEMHIIKPIIDFISVVFSALVISLTPIPECISSSQEFIHFSSQPNRNFTESSNNSNGLEREVGNYSQGNNDRNSQSMDSDNDSQTSSNQHWENVNQLKNEYEMRVEQLAELEENRAQGNIPTFTVERAIVICEIIRLETELDEKGESNYLNEIGINNPFISDAREEYIEDNGRAVLSSEAIDPRSRLDNNTNTNTNNNSSNNNNNNSNNNN